jgi:hypothetical protein
MSFEHSGVEVCNRCSTGCDKNTRGFTFKRSAKGSKAKASLINSNGEIGQVCLLQLPDGDG